MKVFKIMYSFQLEKDLKKTGRTRLETIPWELIAPFEEQALKNHYQNLDKLNYRGGLDPVEMYAVMNNMCFYSVKISPLECLNWIENLVKA